jgi:Glycosyl hydrolase family 99
MPLLESSRLKQFVRFGDALGSPKRRIGVLVALVGIVVLIIRVSGITLGSFQEAASEERRTFVAVADTFARSTEPDRNFGTRSSVRTDASPYVGTFLRFDPAGLGTTVSSAILRVFANSANSGSIQVRGVTSNSWSESTLTYRNMPAVLSVVGSVGRINAGSWAQWDVTSLVRGNDPFSVALTSTSITATNLASRESSNDPQLLVTFSGPPAPSAPSPSPTASPSPSPSGPSSPTSPSSPASPPPSPSPSPSPTQSTSPPPPSGGSQPTFPIRAAFYYPWFPQAWNQQGISPFTNYTPSKGLYDSGNPQLIQAHIAEMQRGRIEAGIASWWGRGHHTDSRVAALLNVAASTPFRWSLYYEAEGSANPTVAAIQEDLSWIATRYAGNGAFLRVGGRPVLFVYGDPGDGCGMADRWVQANQSFGFHLVLKVFSGYRTCASQPDSWHQYAPAKAADSQSPHSYSIAPGFWKAGESVRLARDISRWRVNVRDMSASGARWQLVVSWNEWGEGTQVEGSTQLGDAWLSALATDGAEPSP